MHHMDQFKAHVKIEVGLGSKTKFWKDRWCMDRYLMSQAPNIFRLTRDKDAKVADCWIPRGVEGNWNLNLRRNLNDWEMEEMAALMGIVENHHLCNDKEDVDKISFFLWTAGRERLPTIDLLQKKKRNDPS